MTDRDTEAEPLTNEQAAEILRNDPALGALSQATGKDDDEDRNATDPRDDPSDSD